MEWYFQQRIYLLFGVSDSPGQSEGRNSTFYIMTLEKYPEKHSLGYVPIARRLKEIKEMKTRNLFFSGLSLAALIFFGQGCDRIPDLDLPAQSTTGTNTLGCLINNRVWT